MKVEAYHFDMRKHLVDYDDVMNTHRDVIYREREKVLSGADPKANILDMVDLEIDEIMSEHLAGRTESQWDADAFLRDLGGVFPPATHGLTPDSVLDMSFGGLSDWLHGFARTCYEDLEEKLNPEVASGIAQQVMLRAIDHNWVLHLTGMMDLRESVGLYAYGQRDPLVMYKKEGHDKFLALQDGIQNSIVRTIYQGFYAIASGPGANGRARAAAPPGGASVMGRLADTPSRRGRTKGSGKVGRNSRCPCGSGKKYKRCCGRAA